MRVAVNLVIETTDYGGEAFKRYIEKHIADIDHSRNESRLVGFMMWQIGKPIGDDQRDYQWHETEFVNEFQEGKEVINDGLVQEGQEGKA